MSESKTLATPDLVTQALAFFQASSESDTDQRQREREDLQFQVPELQWPADVQAQRKAQIVSSGTESVTLPARPMLSIPKLDQPIQLVLNQERAAHLGVQVHALTEAASDDTAEILQGLYRRIEVDSRANLARSWAFERAVKCGRGYYRILTEYDPSAGDEKDQRIVIKRVLDQSRVYLDPFAQEPDACDGEKALIVDDMRWTTYKRKYKDSALAKYEGGEFADAIDEDSDWIQGDDEASRKVRVAEFFYVQGEGENRRVFWCKVNAIEVLEGPQELNGRYIPIVPVIGRELIPFDGQRRWAGIVTNNKDAQRLFNYAASGAVEMSALETKASHAIDPEAIEPYQTWWQQKNTRNFPYLPYRRYVNGRDLGPPEPIQADMSKVQMNAILLQQAGDFIHAGTGAFEPTLGQNSPNVRTKGATLALQQQHDEGNSNWLDNLAEISMTLEAKIVLDMIPAIYDRPGRVARILDIEDKAQTVMLNAPFVLDPQTKRPRRLKPGEQAAGAKVYNLKDGRYGVTVSVGKAYKSRVEQGQDQLGNLFRAEPQLFQILGDIYLKFADFPGHLEAAERIKKMLPRQLQDQHDPQAVAQQIPQLQAQLQAQGLQLKQAMEFIQTKQAEQQGKKEIAVIQEIGETQRARESNETKIAVAELGAKVERLTLFLEERARLGVQQDAAHDRAHEVGLATLEQQHALAQGQQDQAHEAAMGAASAGQAADQSAQGHQQALEQLAAQPAPDNGAGA